MFLENIEIDFMQPCLADPEKLRLIARMSADISSLMPYLNSVIKNATYNPSVPTLCFMKEFRMITLHPQKIAVAKALNITDAWQTLDWIKDLINDTYKRRDSIVPSYERRVKINALQIYEWLPKTNCRECGELTCLAFAVKLLSFEQKLENCKPLFTAKHSDLKKAMMDIALALGHELPES